MRIYKRKGHYHIDITIEGKRIRRSLKTENKGEAQRRAVALVAEIEAQLGVTPWHVKSMRVVPLIGEYLEERYRDRPDPRRMRERRRVLMLVLRDAVYVRHLTTSRIASGLSGATAAQRWSNATRNTYRDHVSAFCTWLFRRGILSGHPARRIAKLPTPPSRVRRALTIPELVRLLERSPLNRSSVYAVAAGVGLRRCELRRLRWDDLDLDDRALLELRAEITKEKRHHVLPLSSWVVEFLQRWRDARTLTAPDGSKVRPVGLVWASVPHYRTVKRDLIAAGIVPSTSAGVVDLHALRVTACTMMAQRKVSIQTAMRLMRHRDPRLTINIYTKLVEDDLREGVEALKLPGYPRRDPKAPRESPE